MPSNDETCFICHEGGNNQLGPVRSVCECRWLCVHRVCLSRWQLAKAGSGQERNCRFCSARLPDWKEAHVGQPIAAPIMSVVYDGVIHQLRVSGGEEGKACFEANIRRIFGLGPDEELSLTFGCKVPGDDTQELTLEGWGSFDAAVHCAALNAGARTKDHPITPDPQPKRMALETPSRVFRRLFCGKQGEGGDTAGGER